MLLYKIDGMMVVVRPSSEEEVGFGFDKYMIEVKIAELNKVTRRLTTDCPAQAKRYFKQVVSELRDYAEIPF